MEKRQVIYNRVILVLLVLCIMLATVMSGRVSFPARAESEDVQERYEQTNVLDNLKGSTIAGNKFNIADYPHNENGKPQLISFTEFCYSYYAEKQSDFGLYIYVYNPQDKAIDINTERNKIQMTYGNKAQYQKYVLQFLNYSTEPGYEGRFYKFKIRLSDAEKTDILAKVDSASRVYKISGIELSYKNRVTEFAVAQTYTYSGYALGYGSELAESDSLSCVVDGFDTYVELDVNHTVYRAKGDYYNGEQSQLNSCYFRVPNKLFTDYGELTEIACEWYEYFTKPILITEDNYTFSKINGLHGKNTNTLPTDTYFLFNVFWQNSKTSWFKKSGISDWTSNYGYSVGDTYHWGFLWLNGAEVQYDSFPSFAAAFYTGGSASEDYIVESAALQEKFEENSRIMGGPYIHGNYSAALFEDYDQDGRKMGYNRKDIKATDKMDIFWHYTTKSLWQKMFTGEQDVDTVHESLDAIVKVTDSDLNGNNAEIAERLKISEKDVDKIKKEQSTAKANNETVVLFRYSSTKYFSAPAVSSYCRSGDIDGGKTLVRANAERWGDGDMNAYVCQETVYLDFDIISLTYTNDGIETVIPVVASPQDVFSELEPPLEEPEDNSRNIFMIILGVILGILLLILLLRFAPGLLTVIFKGIFFIISLPFRLIGALFKPAADRAKARSERKKIERETEKEQKRIEKENERKRREDEAKAQKEREKQEREAEREKKAEQRDMERLAREVKRKQRKARYKNAKKQLTLADLEGMSDAELADLYYEEYGLEDIDVPEGFWDN